MKHMDSSILLVAVSIVSVVIGATLEHIFQMRRECVSLRRYPFQMLYGKQIEFFDKAVPLLDKLNGYITEIDVWLCETGEDAKERVLKAVENSLCVTQFYDLVGQYYLYLPKKLLNEASELWWKCLGLGESPTTELTYESINLLFKFQNTIRKFVGVEELSRDLLKAFRSETREKEGSKDEKEGEEKL
jgi:hypothetical protein